MIFEEKSFSRSHEKNANVWLSLFLAMLGNMCIAIVCFPGWDLINFEINLSYQAIFRSGQKFSLFLKAFHWSKENKFFSKEWVSSNVFKNKKCMVILWFLCATDILAFFTENESQACCIYLDKRQFSNVENNRW